MKHTRIITALFVAALGVTAMSSCKLTNHRSMEELMGFADREGNITINDSIHADRYTMGGASFDGQKVEEIEIEWCHDSVQLLAYDGTAVVISETADTQLNDLTTMYHYLTADGELKIAFGKPGTKIKYPGVPNKRLLVMVPRSLGLDKVEVNGLDHALRMDNVACERVELNSVTSNVVLNECKIEELEVNGIHTDLESTFGQMPGRIEMNSVSGNTKLYVPEDAGMEVEMNGMNQSFDCELPVGSKGGKKVVGNGACKIECNGVSSSLRIAARKQQ